MWLRVTNPMPVPHEVIARLSLSVQPLVFETGITELPYSTAGTVFLAGYEGKPYVITTRHGLNAENPPPVCVFLSDISQRILPLRNVFFVPRTDEPEDFMDLAVIEINSTAMADPELSQATLIDLALACAEDWQTDADQSEFFTIGYPCERSNVDYDIQELRTDRITLYGKYSGPLSLSYLHTLEIKNAQGLSSFSGFSGAPVFAWHVTPGQRPKPVLCGMALRGTPSSGFIHFLAASVLLDALKIKRQHENWESMGLT